MPGRRAKRSASPEEGRSLLPGGEVQGRVPSAAAFFASLWCVGDLVGSGRVSFRRGPGEHFGEGRAGSSEPGEARGSVRRLGSVRLGPAGSARLGSARLGGSARLSSTRRESLYVLAFFILGV